MDKQIPLLGIILLVAVLVGSVSFTVNPSINNNQNSTTLQDLNCDWIQSGDTTNANVSWYLDGSSYLNVSGATPPSTIDSSNTTRGQVWNCTVTLSNSTDTAESSDAITIINANPNLITVYNESPLDIGNQTTLLEDVARAYTAITTDPDGDTVSYSTIGLPSGASFDSGTGILTWTPISSQVGNTTITFIALDNQTPDRGSSAKDIIFTVIEVNDAPTFSPALTNQAATEGNDFTYNITAIDEENDVPLVFTMVTNLSSIQINSTDNTTTQISFISGSPSFSDRGNHTVIVNVTDARNGSSIDSFVLEVIPVNQLPILTFVPTNNGTQGQEFNITVNATDLDIADVLSFAVTPISCSVNNPWVIVKIDQSVPSNYTYANASINQIMTNDHVACPYVNISVSDGKESDWQQVFFNTSNINDAPVLYEISVNTNNSDGDNISNQDGYANTAFRYLVNYTDVDSLTPGGEVLTFTDNTSLFIINSTTGFITFTPNESDIGNHTIEINVSDDEGLSDIITMNLEIRNNSIPSILQLGNISCVEDSLCTYWINGTDPDGDNLTFSSNNTAAFNITTYNVTHGLLNTTYLQSFVGNYSIRTTTTDIRGATDTTDFIFQVNNTNDAPILDAVSVPWPLVETYLVSFTVSADDEDRLLYGGAELLNFSDNTTLFNITTSFNNVTNLSTGVIQFTPGTSTAGNYTVNVSVSDPWGLTDWETVNFEIFNKTFPPNITDIRPYGGPFSNTTVYAFTSTSNYNESNTTIYFNEDTTVLFNHTTIDDTTPLENLSYTWYLNGMNVSSNFSYSQYFSYYSAGTHTMRLIVQDDRLENATWDWLITIGNINRPPILHSDLENASIDSTETFTSYLYLRDELRFLDDDDDPSGNSRIDDNETNTLTYSVTACSVADVQITDQTVRLVPEEVGTCQVRFNATDPDGASIESNLVFINVTDVPNGTTIEVPTVASGGGGGGGGSANIIIPREVEVDSPKPLNLITPEEVTIYRNRTITVPILLENTWNESLLGINLVAQTNLTNVQIELSQSYFEELALGEVQKTDLTVKGYRIGENFEIQINATVDDPEFSDTATIFFNSIEQTEMGEQVRVKVTFAQDLLNTNSECQELGELLNKAEREEEGGNYGEALKIVDTVINGCRYLVSKNQVNLEQPREFNLNFLKRFNFFYIGAGILLLVFITAIVAIELKIRKDKS